MAAGKFGRRAAARHKHEPSCIIADMKVLAELMRRLDQHPNLSYQVEGHILSVLSADAHGFTVSLWDEAPQYTVFFDMWHTQLHDAEQALNCFAFGLSDNCRIKVTCRGGLPHAWSVERRKKGNEWVDYELVGRYPTGYILFPHRHKAEVKYLQNHFVAHAHLSCY